MSVMLDVSHCQLLHVSALMPGVIDVLSRQKVLMLGQVYPLSFSASLEVSGSQVTNPFKNKTEQPISLPWKPLLLDVDMYSWVKFWGYTGMEDILPDYSAFSVTG